MSELRPAQARKARRAEDSWSFEPGTEVVPGRTAVRLLGGGDRYEAWLGWDDHLATTVVLKLLRPSQVDSERARRAITREATTLNALAHPGIVRCFGADIEAPRPYLVLEFLDGPRLSTLLRRFGPLAPEQLVPLAVEVSSALRYMHNQGWLHLDIKPQNLIMSAPPRVIDMSIARRGDAVAGITKALGTEAYMAPEQALPGSGAGIGPWSDVWGLGATLYEAVNGHRPFPRKPAGEPLAQISQDPSPFHARVPPRLREIIGECLAREAAQRPALADVTAFFEEMLPDSRDEAQRRLRRRIR